MDRAGYAFRQIKPVGLTGGIASGKTTVAALFRDLGAITIDADRIAKTVMEPGKPALDDLVGVFGKEILTENGELNRQAMLGILLNQPSAMEKQLAVLKPHILPTIDKIAEETIRSSPGKIVIVEAPLLFEYGQPERYHPIILVSVPREKQIQRLMKRSGKDREWASRVVDLQWPLSKKECLSDLIIKNDKSMAHTKLRVLEIFELLPAYFTH